MEISELKDILHKEQCSCVIYNHGNITLCHERGVKDLLHLLESKPEILADSIIADKVVGKGAAALMISGKVKALYADVISDPAYSLLATAHVQVFYNSRVSNIVNRAGTGICPVEDLCKDCKTAADCLPLIKDFVNKQNNKITTTT